jgi:GT2 family glycosyltransferase
MNAPDVTIVIPTFNRLDLTVVCLDAIERATPAGRFEVVAVDNASSDGTPSWLREQQGAGRLRAILNAQNLGFGRACNLGARVARGRYVLLLNSDTEVQPGWLEAIVGKADSDPGIGVAGARLLYPNGTVQHAGIAFENGLPYHIHRGARPDDPRVLKEREFAAVTGACFLIARDLYERLGGFDESYHMYVEDVDLCLRVWEAGLRVVYCPDCVVVHHESASITDLERRDAMVREGWARLHERWAGRWPAGAPGEEHRATLDGTRSFVVLAFADELAARPELLAAYTRAFSGADDATLLVYAPGRDPAALGALLGPAVEQAGLPSENAADILAVASPRDPAAEATLARGADAVLTHERVGGLLALVPQFGEEAVDRLRSLAESRWTRRAA